MEGEMTAPHSEMSSTTDLDYAMWSYITWAVLFFIVAYLLLQWMGMC